ncbi:MAG: aminoacyl-tRNA hydrolase [Desulfarculaceae bacterium]|nr:aminoacyl-tRNA hydrolase [Desulfarculaceae bacterium]
MSTDSVHMVAGLGNPGKNYHRTRHNVGFMVADRLAQRCGGTYTKSRYNAEFVKTVLNKRKILVVKPCSYMNRSGQPIASLAAYFKIQSADLIVVHDDLDLPFGRIRISKDRGHGGHNGIRSIIEALGTRDFSRIRIGVGRPGAPSDVTGHVLGDFSKGEAVELDDIIDRCADACIDIIKNGPVDSMNTYNRQS